MKRHKFYTLGRSRYVIPILNTKLTTHELQIDPLPFKNGRAKQVWTLKNLCTPSPTLPETNSKRTWKWMVGSLFSGMVSGMAYWSTRKPEAPSPTERNGPAWRQGCERSRVLNWDPMTKYGSMGRTLCFYLRENHKKSTVSWIGKYTIRHGIWNLDKSWDQTTWATKKTLHI